MPVGTDYIPVYFQACKGASPIRSGVDMLATALVIAPFALICGIIIKVSNKYRPANAMGWILTIIGFGLLSLLKADSPVKTWVGYQFLVSAGTGMIVRVVHHLFPEAQLTWASSLRGPYSRYWRLCLFTSLRRLWPS